MVREPPPSTTRLAGTLSDDVILYLQSRKSPKESNKDLVLKSSPETAKVVLYGVQGEGYTCWIERPW